MEQQTITFFKPVPGFDDYFISDQGRISSLKNGSSKILKQRISICGYFTVELSKKGERKMCHVHVLVARTWLENPLNLPVVNHKDGNKLNPSVENLEYVSYKENNAHARNVLGVGRCIKAVCQVSLEGTLINTFESLKEAAEVTGVDGRAICQVCQGKRRKAGDFVWCYKENYRGNAMRRFSFCKPVFQCDLQDNVLARFESCLEAASHVGALASNVSNACSGRLKTCKGYKWRYVKKEVDDETKDWVVLDRYPAYKISQDGRVYSFWLKRMKKPMSRGNYKIIGMRNSDGKEEKVFVHRLVAMAYLSNPKNHPIINHIDGNPSNNNMSNLEWCTFQENSIHAYSTGLNKSKKGVIKMDSAGKELARYPSLKEAAKVLGTVSPHAISNVCRKVKGAKTAGGFYWKYA